MQQAFMMPKARITFENATTVAAAAAARHMQRFGLEHQARACLSRMPRPFYLTPPTPTLAPARAFLLPLQVPLYARALPQSLSDAA